MQLSVRKHGRHETSATLNVPIMRINAEHCLGVHGPQLLSWLTMKTGHTFETWLLLEIHQVHKEN